MNSKKLHPVEISDLAELEARIERTYKPYREAGCSLSSIRDRKLYRENGRTFGEYLQARWEMSEEDANVLISAEELILDFPLLGGPPKIRWSVYIEAMDYVAHVTVSAHNPWEARRMVAEMVPDARVIFPTIPELRTVEWKSEWETPPEWWAEWRGTCEQPLIMK